MSSENVTKLHDNVGNEEDDKEYEKKVPLLQFHCDGIEKENSEPLSTAKCNFLNKESCAGDLKNYLPADGNESVILLLQENLKTSKSKEDVTGCSICENVPENVRDPSKPSKECDTDKNSKTGYKKYLGIVLALAAAFQFSSSGTIIKILNYQPFNLGVWRFLIMILIPIPFLLHAVLMEKQSIFKDIWPFNKTTGLLLLQAAVGSNSLILLFFGIQNLNFADCLVISTSAPVFVTFMAYFFLGEKCGGFPIFTALLTLCGVAIIARPPLLTGEGSMERDAIFGVSMAFGSMMLLTVSYVIMRQLRTIHHALINVAFCTWGLVQSTIIAISLDVILPPSSLSEIGLIIATSLLAFFAQTCITLALKYEQAGPVALVRTSEVIFAFILQQIFLQVNPDIFSIIGTALVITGVLLTTFRKMISGYPENHKYRKIFWLLLK